MANLLRRLRRACDAVWTRARFERDMRDEIHAHIQHRADDLASRGMTPDEAARRARLEFGAINSWKEQCRDARGVALVRPFLGLFGDIAFACRRLLATPLFLAFAVLSLALGVSVTTTVYSTLYALLWKPLGIRDAPQVAVVTASDGRERWRSTMSGPDFEDLRQRQQSFADVAAYREIMQPLELPRASELAVIEAVTGNYFGALGVGAAHGRVLQPSDDERGAPVLVLSDVIWRRRFDADPAVVGKTVRIGGWPVEIVGVAQTTFAGLQSTGGRPPAGWMPLSTSAQLARPAPASADPRDRRDLTVVGRLAPERTATTAAAELAAIGATLDGAHPAHAFRAGDGARLVVARRWSARPAAASTTCSSP
jgi:hypothetical protein